MSRSSYIELRLFYETPPTTLLSLLIEHGWYLHAKDGMYLPLGDDPHDWQTFEGESIEKLWEILREKEAQHQPLGVGASWRDTEVSAIFTLTSTTIHLNLDIHPDYRLRGLNNAYPDVTWYLQTLLPPLLAYRDHSVEQINWSWHW